MPVYNGVELMGLLKEEQLLSSGSHTVLVSAMDESTMTMIPTGLFDSYVTKPYSLSAVFREILKYFLK